MTSKSPRPTRAFGALAVAGILVALIAVAISATWRWFTGIVREEAAREAELEDWAHAEQAPPIR